MKKSLIPLLSLSFLLVPVFGHAYEINYASVEDIAGEEVLLKYRTTDGYTFARCGVDGECGELLSDEYEGSNAPNIFPEIFGTRDYVTSVDGRRAVVEYASIDDKTYRALYAIEGGEPSFAGLIPYTGPSIRTSISYANDAVVFLRSNGVITRYDTHSEELDSVATGRTSLPYWSLSEHGTFLASYNSLTERQEIWNLVTGEKKTALTNKPSYAVFSDSEEDIAFLREVDGFNKLFVADIDNLSEARDIAEGDYTVVEYEFVGDTLYYIANSKDDPYAWNLYAFDVEDGELEVVDENVGYDDAYGNLKKTHSTLFYEKVNGTNKDVIAYSPEEDSRTVLSAVEPREASEEIERSIVNLAGVPGVLLAPEGADEDDELPLVVWLHGGPMRQTSLGYHTYYGYAVYDELLERYAEEAYVLKLDYTGSWGHGNEYQEALEGEIGRADVDDVLAAIEEFKEEREVDSVYLFGNSYGGYLGPRVLVEEPGEIEAVVAIAGVLDWESLVARIPSSPFRDYFDGLPSWRTAPAYEAASVRDQLRSVDDDKEILLVYGEGDTMVPTWQSKEFYALAKAQDKNIDLVAYEDEGHTILQRENLVDLCERTAEVFDLSVSLCRG